MNIIILTHGEWGKYLIESSKMIVGDFRDIYFIPLNPKDTLEEFYKKVFSLVEALNEKVIFITDIAGGTTTNTALKIAYKNKLKVLSGLSAPLLFEVISSIEELENEEVIDEIIKEARDNCKDVLKEILAGGNNE